MTFHYQGNQKQRLDVFVHEELPAFSRSQIQKMIKGGLVTVNNTKTSVHHWLHAGDRITVEDTAIGASHKPRHSAKTAEEPTIVFQNEEYAIIVKPAGLLTHPTEHGETDTLTNWLQRQFPRVASVGDPLRPGIVHRLDKDVGGLVLVALTQSAYDYFKNLFHNRQIEKHYACLVHGEVSNDEGTISAPVERNKKSGKMVAQTATREGKEALTSYTITKRFKNYTLLDVQIHTGRTHQIRTHLYSIGHSIVGDPLYQTRDIRKRGAPNLPLMQPFLFACRLAFTAPDGAPQQYTLELPSHLQETLTTLQPL